MSTNSMRILPRILLLSLFVILVHCNSDLSSIVSNFKDYVSEPSSLQIRPINQQSQPVNYTLVKTSLGGIVGVVENNYRSFKGIPFAQAPINNLRWEAPKPPNGKQEISHNTNNTN